MSLPEPKYIPASKVPINKQRGTILKMLAKIPEGQSAVLEFPTVEEAKRRQQNITSVICQQKKQGKFKNHKALRSEKTVYVVNSQEAE